MRPLYALSFSIDGDRLDDLTEDARRWIASKYATWDGNLYLDGQPLGLPTTSEAVVSRHEAPGGRYLTLDLEHPDDRTDARRWHTGLTLATDGATTECSTVISIRTDGFGVFDPAAEQIHTPRFVRDILKRNEAKVGPERIATEAFLVQGPQGVTDLVSILTHPQRTLPVVLIAQESQTGEPLVDRVALQRRLVGLARVVEIGIEESFDLSDEVGKLRSCFDGGVRVYWPGFSADADPYRHPFYLKHQIRQMQREMDQIEDDLFGRFVQTAVARFEGGVLFRRLRRREEEARRGEVRRFREARAKAPTKEAWIAELERDIEEVTVENEALRDERDGYELDVLVLEDLTEQLRRDLDKEKAKRRYLESQASGEPVGPDDDTVELVTSLRLSETARESYEKHTSRQKKFNALLSRLRDETYRNGVGDVCSGGYYVAPRTNTDERVFFEVLDGAVHVYELFPKHQDELADSYNQLCGGGLNRADYGGFELWEVDA